jgi:hypothetical protein
VNPLSPRFLSLACLPAQLLSPLRDKGFPPADNDSSKGTQTLRLSTPQGTAWSCDCSKEGQKDNPFSASSRQSTLQRQRAVSMSPTPGHAGVHATRMRDKPLGAMLAMSPRAYKTRSRAPKDSPNSIGSSDPLELHHPATSDLRTSNPG